MIAMALVNDPDLLIADEPTTALDVTTQAQILNLMDKLQEEFGSAIIMITHDLGVVAEIADDVVVMYAAKVVEQAPVDELFKHPRHPYTWGLLGSLPRLDTDVERLVQIPGSAAVAAEPAAGLPVQPALRVRRSTAARRSSPSSSRCRATPSTCRRASSTRRRRSARAGSCSRAKAIAGGGDSLVTADELLVVEDLKKHFPVTRGIIFQKQVAAVKAVDGVSFTRQPRARRSASSASPAAASRRWRAASCACSTRPAARSSSTGGTSRSSSRAEMRPIRREMMMIFQDPYASLNPRKRVGFIVAEALEVHKIGHGRRDQAARPGAARDRRPQPGALQPLPARVLRRPAPAHRRRARTRRQPEADRLRRARLGARRLGAGADPQPAQGPAGRVRPHVHLHRARSERRPPHLRPRDGDVPRQVVEIGRPRAALQRAEAPVHRRAPLGGARCPIPSSAAQRKRIVLEGDVPEPDQPAVRLPLPPALPALPRGRLRRRGPADPRVRRRSHGRVPLPARALAADGRSDASSAGEPVAR